jgi:hypothetical protein
MTTFDKREDAFENKYIHDQELSFKIGARRNKFLAQWAAAQMHYDPAKTDQYVDELIRAAVNAKTNQEIINRIVADLKAAGVAAEELVVHKQLLLYEKKAHDEFHQ